LIRNAAHLHRVLAICLEHYHSARPHRSLDLQTPLEPSAVEDDGRPVERIDLLGGLLHQYQRVA
jgi:hypothetical protein